MKQLLPYYEAELSLLRRYCRGFAERYPTIAGSLLLAGDSCKDPHVERMIQSSALLAARISKRLDDDYPLFTESLLETLYPHYLRSFPAMSIVHADARGGGAALPDAVTVVPRGAIMKSAPVQGIKCQFRTASKLVLAPVNIAAARFYTNIEAAPALRLAAGVNARISIDIHSAGRPSLNELDLECLRLFIDGEPALCAALRDTLFMHTSSAYVAFGEATTWQPLRDIPLAAVGYAQEDALIPYPARSHPAYRLLTEYFGFPEKFNFIDLLWREIAQKMPPNCRSFQLNLALKDVDRDSSVARTLAKLSVQHLLLHCVPVVNLFPRSAAPVNISHCAPDYAVLADAALPHGYDIYQIVSAQLLTDVSRPGGIEQVQPFYSMRHGQQENSAIRYWIMRRDEISAEISPGHEMRIALVDTELTPVSPPAQTLSVELLCSNRALPTALSYGAPDGDLSMEGWLGQLPLRLLRKPSAPYRFESGNGAHWRLIAHLSLNHRALSSMGVEEFRKMLALYNLPRSAASRRQIEGIVDLQYKAIMAWIPGKPCAALMPGMEICMTLDEDAFIGSSVHLFIQVLDHFFGLYSQVNVFSQLLVLSKQTGEQLQRCQPRSGDKVLV